MNRNEHELELMRLYLEGVASLEETQELEALIVKDASVRQDFLRYTHLDSALAGVRRSQPSVVTPRRSVWLSWRPLTAAAALVILGAISWLAFPVASETGLTLASADSAVKVERKGATLMLPVGAMLREGDVVASEGAGIVVSYPEEETRLELAPQTRLEVLGHRSGKQLRLQTGSLSAEVSPQPEGRPMRLFSPGAEAVVLGTRFTLNADPANRELAVQKGAVRVNRAETADSIVVSAAEKVKLGAKSLELEPLPPLAPPPWRDKHTLAFDFESVVDWPVLRCGRIVTEPAGNGRCLTGELVEVVRRKSDKLVLATSLRPQCVLSDTSHLKLRYWVATGIESIRVYLYVFGVERAFNAELKPVAHDRWVEWSIPFDELKSATGAPPLPDASVRSISVHTSPVNGPLAFHVDDVALEHVSPLPLSR